MKVELENVKPMDIEKRSFEIITQELGDKALIPGTELIVKRCIHTSADFDYADNLCFSPDAVEKAIEAIKNGACIVTDTQMAKSGINKRLLPVTAAKYTALCQTRMWRSPRRKTEPPGLRPVWTRRPPLGKS